MKKLLLIINPRSGKGSINAKLPDIIGLFESRCFEVTVHSTRGKNDATELVAEKAADYDLVVCAGGDGTLNETITGLQEIGLKIPVGYIPAGSTNDFASSIGLPKDAIKAARTVVSGTPFSCDIGDFNGKTFVYTAAFGILSDIPYRTKQGMKNVFGHFAYLLESTKEFVTAPFGFYPSIDLTVSVNGESFEDTFCYGMITNTSSIGGIKGVAGADVEMDDGLLEVTLIRRPKLALWFPEIFARLNHLIKDSKYVYTCKASHILLRAKKPLAWTLDGEFGEEWKEAEIICKHRAVEIIRRRA